MANGRASVSGEGRALSRATRHKSSERYPPRPSAVQSMLRAGQGGRGPMQARARAREGEPERVPADRLRRSPCRWSPTCRHRAGRTGVPGRAPRACPSVRQTAQKRETRQQVSEQLPTGISANCIKGKPGNRVRSILHPLSLPSSPP